MSGTNKFEELIEYQEDWINQLSKSLNQLKKFKSGERTCSDEHFERLKQEHVNLAQAVKSMSERINSEK
ncbi:hypothetical protein HJ140_23450 [Vibrio parahaemolyticus]|uniref:hypothetical protein n=1 Tax=Vibrio parahaemolyticus TaxID=670 RepID=UPI0003ED8CA5|nr:hypothetical protein [Vibrio parahaemolyticus]AHI99327.1 hypothetical protein VPUCM_1369 [Vibrio parahaemolyticus UCM-V493]MBE3972474.1 hypothetical protein [Vibrio parahaemolyticus]MBE3981348.1 hypothetical protein [Vibrio parahaemolyticus]MBE4399463.1 hypothetical protein [Vibrio parahaemolyticus]MBE5118829.1 hypothetical protein [Vibrio parahaemolyticus]